MNQRFIELGEGYGDIYELRELITSNQQRFTYGFVFISTNPQGQDVLSIAAAFKPASEGNFMPIYICREGIPVDSKRLKVFEQAVAQIEHTPIKMEVKHSSVYADRKFYYNHLISVLRLNHYIPPMQ
ncbi:hypothetical protein A1A1_04207 [Planococcus antarcticus DSM 14505]|uniref:Methylthioribose kinase n=1 Tax=Planococcus antarcticus DSM 14505 TaxID=1185653 RepID=A0A1C7DG81_9BACL|nr:hypothetical protein [Planococcus antarcticus]ANU10454.1 methylthioribose kinase [Planococcus antarcticus DSM 14505]EIM07810.1 hypothetical protein A1A1_04207 [Planococcus antarcticus DSM 14505]